MFSLVASAAACRFLNCYPKSLIAAGCASGVVIGFSPHPNDLLRSTAAQRPALRTTLSVPLETIDPSNPVVALCAEGMAAEGTPAEARRLFEQAWAARRDDYEAAIAAHFLARHQVNAADTLYWNALAVRHAEAVPGARTAGFMASLYLNLGDAQANIGDTVAARAAVRRAAAHVAALAPGGYRELVALGIRRLAERVGVASDVDADT